jgi:fructokinase
LTNIVKMNVDEMHLVKQLFDSDSQDNIEFLKNLLVRFQIDLAAVTLGPYGCIIVDRKSSIHHSGFNINAVDTTGSGDAFAAGLMVKYLAKASLNEIADYANALGAFTATQKGAVPAWTQENLQEIRKHVNPSLQE